MTRPERAYIVNAALLLGASVLAVGFGGPIAKTLLTREEPGFVRTCTVVHVHKYYSDVVLDDGRARSLSSFDIPDASGCLPPGTGLEKRRGEWRFRVNGVATPIHAWMLFPEVPLAILGLVLLAAGIFRKLRAERPSEDQDREQPDS